MRANFLIFVFGCSFTFVCIHAAKTITISSPSCNLNTVIEVPTTQCCCATPSPPTPTPPASNNTLGCPTRIKYQPPVCVTKDTTKYRGSDCYSYYECTGNNKFIERGCELKKFSEKQQACVPPPNFDNCCVA